jgi:hypothetical protein
MKAITIAVLAATLAALPAQADCDPPGSFRLYRSSAAIPNARIHVATFDSTERGALGTDYNRENCRIAAQQFMAQPGVVVRHWCEPVNVVVATRPADLPAAPPCRRSGTEAPAG